MTVDEALRRTRAELAAVGVATPALDARLLVCAATGLNHERLIFDPDRPMSEQESLALVAMTARRLGREPVSRIVGEREFWGRSFAVAPATLDPRADSETAVEAMVDWLRRHGPEEPTILDLGTGTGCLLISVLAEIDGAWGVGVDIDPEALKVASKNARLHLAAGRASFVCGDWLAPLGCRFDAIVANPPYIPAEEIKTLEPEVAGFDPRGALDGGLDGLDAYRRILRSTAAHLQPGGTIVLEIGDRQEDEVSAMIDRSGLVVSDRRFDLAGRTRCICATPLA